ncbi:hypothetical protein NW765_008066 [Fusarium oxysporum]|nr:hypothetical protein FOWG_12926 [Fusarium oxysporum f. sp. lycopersici MN25]KAJ4134037.1 hypothetical protein NW765_008066 [Fusarium oxysporum]KAJ4270960.1 hypothetical protein NW764_013841 [Fusarium oxysporum]
MERGFNSEYFDQGLAAYFSGQVNPDLLQVGFAGNEASPAVKAEPSSPDTMAAPESHRSPSLYDIPPFIAAHIPPQGNVDEIDINSRENEANPVVKVEPSSPDTMAVPESPRSPSLYDIQPFYAAPVITPPQPAPEEMKRPIPSRQPSPRTSPQRNPLRSPLNGRGTRRNLQFFINRGSQRRAIGQAQLSRRLRMQEQQFELRRHQRHVNELQRQHEQRLQDEENAPCNSMPVSRKRRYHGAPRYIERFSIRDEDERGRLSPYDFY